MAFLSLLDDRAKPKGSRDPLGFELVWTYFGRRLIGNLTTVTSSLSNFAVALLGYRWANEINSNAPADEKQHCVRGTFLRYEQMAGYLRYLAGDKEIMGITRVSQRMDSKQTPVSFGLGADQQILSDQASYGLWGLYSTASAQSGLVTGDTRIPTAFGCELALKIEQSLDKSSMIDLLTSNKAVSHEQLVVHARSFLKAINTKFIRTELLHALMNGGDGHAMQAEVWRITQELAERKVEVTSLADFIQCIKRQTHNQLLVRRLENIEAVERILVAANNIFNYCRLQDGKPLSTVMDGIGDRYHYLHLPTELDLTLVPRGDLVQSISVALRNNDIEMAIERILELNKVVMEQRSGAPWVELEPSRQLRVRVPTETYALLHQEELEVRWDYEYFISSFLRIANHAQGTQWKVL